MAIPIIDLFAGPGGLGEGFSNVLDENGERFFDIKLSIEKDPYAHQTLLLRSFLRQFPIGRYPIEYYEMVKKNSDKKREQLKQSMFDQYPAEFQIAKDEAWRCELGSDDFPATVVDERISRSLDGSDDWVLIGGPPCQAYSLVGRSRNRGISEEDDRVFLYREYLRIIAKHHPKVFVMENVKGLLSAKLDSNKIFDWIKQDLKNPGRLFPRLDSPTYKLFSFVKTPDDYDERGNPVYKNDKDFLIKSEEYHIPQKRHRVIILGIRDDTVYTPEILQVTENISLKSVIDDLPKIRSIAGRKILSEHKIGGRTKRVYEKLNDNNTRWGNYIGEFHEEFRNYFERHNNAELNLNGGDLNPGSNFIKQNLSFNEDHPLFIWTIDKNIGGVLQHESRSHLYEDLRRYYFYSIYSRIYGKFPRLKNIAEYSKEILPKHNNVLSGKFEDRFRVQMPDIPATTVTSHISKDGHYFIHYDPEQCRSLTVREAARIQTFPDNYFFHGPRTQQYHQVGNAVPSFLAYKIGHIVKNIY